MILRRDKDAPWREIYERQLSNEDRLRVEELCRSAQLEEQALLLIYHQTPRHRASWDRLQSLLADTGIDLSDSQTCYLVKRLLERNDVDGEYMSEEEYMNIAKEYMRQHPQSCVYSWVSGSPEHTPPQLIVRQEWYRKWCTNRMKVFLCHASEEKNLVRELRGRLILDGVNSWFDEDELLPGHDWQLEIRKAVRQSDAILILLSKRSVTKRGFVQKEIKYALDIADEQPEGAIFIIPAKLDDAPVPVQLSKWQWVNLYEDTGYQRLLSALRCAATALLRR